MLENYISYLNLVSDPRILHEELQQTLQFDTPAPRMWDIWTNPLYSAIRAFFSYSPYVPEHIERSGAPRNFPASK
jgi:hypothetical protein